MKIDRAGVIKKSHIFSGLTESEIVALATLFNERRLVTDEFVFWEGDAPEWLYLLAEGKVKVVKHSSQGKEFIIAFFGAGEMFGEVAVFENRPYPASAQALQASVVLGIRRQDFVDFLAKQQEVSLKIISVLGGRLREAQERLRDLAGERVEQRLARTLLMLASKLGSTLPFTRQEIADMAGTTTETAIRFLSNLNQRNITRSARGKIEILNEQKLRLLSEGPPQIY